jgi:malonyl CoA-acyl carrier protein transacylase
MARMKELGATKMIEFGTGKVLSGLAKKIDSEAQAPFNINTLDDLKTLEASLTT